MMIGLPVPLSDGRRSLEQVLKARRSVRAYQQGALTLAEVAQLLWAGQGITSNNGMHTAPSAGALYPLELYVEASEVTGLAAGVYRYLPQGHQLVPVAGAAGREALTAASYGQGCVARGAANIVVAAVYARTARKYGERASRYVHLEAGHAAQNIWLQAVALGLGTVVVGAFDDARVQAAMRLAPAEDPLCIMPVGRVRA